ncbi:thioredoxin reductase (NADPH)/alkyl hydroperoxide reductase subunit F [Streptomyces sp. PvR006]|uniref:FAD-dependent oxidoreductase n=1 Tax=Streptomyces sp. PvR006 TaxID=2817860 RepID=UPI001AE76E13|nr:FAD-dependent oxidoreductase [Streptomyces sp. PvR006]MBP2585580.1 thioredoxin reductase (NADPH)/alkyl hydroperoxide reductase subunit F [Streptomyces sp. PvR006]
MAETASRSGASVPVRTSAPAYGAAAASAGTTDSADTTDTTDLIVVGGGPAGCAAARTAAGVGMRTILIEPDGLCRTLHRIPALDNVLGGWTDGRRLADSVAAEIRATRLCRLELGSRVRDVHADDERVTVTVTVAADTPDAPDACGSTKTITAPYAVIATGVAPVQPADAAWITAPRGLRLPPLWRADAAADVASRTILVLGGDRPIGTFLRAHPDTGTRLLVAYPGADAYKTEEIRDDPRVTLLPVRHVTLTRHGPDGVAAELTCRDGERRTVTADAAYASIGSAPAAPGGGLVRGGDGYCRPADQHPRLLVAGDLRGARFQRIMTAMGSGSEAALQAYYASLTRPSATEPSATQPSATEPSATQSSITRPSVTRQP